MTEEGMRVAVIGGGIAGLTVAWELSICGHSVELFERHPVQSGASVQNGSVLHSGARYLIENVELATLCWRESRALCRIVPDAIGRKWAIYIVLPETPSSDIEAFEYLAKEVGIPARPLSRVLIEHRVPGLARGPERGYLVPDLVLDGVSYLFHYRRLLESVGTRVNFSVPIERIEFASSLYRLWTREQLWPLEFDIVVNCTGSSLPQLPRTLGLTVRVYNVRGSMFYTPEVYSDHIVTTCGTNFDGNTIVPVKNGSLLGSTWMPESELMQTAAERVRANCSRLIDGEPEFDLSATRTSFRTHLGEVEGGRSGIAAAIVDHGKEGFPGFFSLLPGKFVLHRYAARLLVDTLHESYVNCDRSVHFD